PAAPPPKAAAPAAKPVAPPARPAAPAPRQAEASGRHKKPVDVLGELEKLRQEVRGRPHPPRKAKPASNGHGELSREIQMTVDRADFRRLRRISLNLQVEDEDHRVVNSVRDFHVDIRDPQSLEKVLLRLSIALNAKG
ncbi:MAG: hypothetical protein KDD11_10815, partial [Acidobacteria bacterium]|nr:hypothetical protein [Acidobacteriota bacterium]